MGEDAKRVEGKVVREGEEEITLRKLVMYAGAVTDFNEIHYDPDFASKAGFEKPIAHGMFSASVCVRELSKIEDPTKIKRIYAKFSRPVPVGSKVKIKVIFEGETEENGTKYRRYRVDLVKENGERAVQCEVLVEV